MIKGTTTSGFAFEVDEEVRDDMELLEELVKLDAGDVAALPDVLVSILGADQKKALYDHCRSEKGRVKSSQVSDELREIFEVIGEQGGDLKN